VPSLGHIPNRTVPLVAIARENITTEDLASALRRRNLVIVEIHYTAFPETARRRATAQSRQIRGNLDFIVAHRADDIVARRSCSARGLVRGRAVRRPIASCGRSEVRGRGSQEPSSSIPCRADVAVTHSRCSMLFRQASMRGSATDVVLEKASRDRSAASGVVGALRPRSRRRARGDDKEAILDLYSRAAARRADAHARDAFWDRHSRARRFLVARRATSRSSSAAGSAPWRRSRWTSSPPDELTRRALLGARCDARQVAAIELEVTRTTRPSCAPRRRRPPLGTDE